MMDIYQFIDSKGIREHCRKLDYSKLAKVCIWRNSILAVLI